MTTTEKRLVRKRMGVAFANFSDAFAAGGRDEFTELTMFEIVPKEPGESLYAWATSQQQAGLAVMDLLFDIGKISDDYLICKAREAVVAARDDSDAARDANEVEPF